MGKLRCAPQLSRGKVIRRAHRPVNAAWESDRERKWESGKVKMRESGKVGKWKSGKVGKWESGKAGKWESGKVGKRESGKVKKASVILSLKTATTMRHSYS